ncbi:MAG TPA: TetR/AcrR family transcriptional regulator [Acidimicrobiales bacterium]|jgi:AcrR family transcriptional regulator|nr:TetR/AcrR family transcriptional regulator [Acidimicrobiales bacterium]
MAAVRRTDERVIDATLRCLARHGLRGTTVDDVASEAGVSRATLYRAFPGGRETILAAVVDAECARLFGAVTAAAGDAPDLHAALVDGLVAAATWLTGHEVLERLMFDEPATLLTHLEFEQMDRTLSAVATRAGPLLGRFVEPALAARLGEWVARLAVSYLLFPSDEVDLCDRASVDWLVRRYVGPGVAAAAAEVREGETVSTKLS